MTKQPTRERERQQWQKKNDIIRAYGIITGLLAGYELSSKENCEEIKQALVEVREILKKYGGIE